MSGNQHSGFKHKRDHINQNNIIILIYFFYKFVWMKKLIPLSFLVLFISLNTEFCQLFKLPALVQHYLDHKKEDSSETFWHFLSQHYSSKINHSHPDNHHDHERLPFKTDDCSILHVNLAFIPSIQPSAPAPVNSTKGENAIQVVLPNYFGYSGSIWQPPKIA